MLYDPGHIYMLPAVGRVPMQVMTFVKRSGGAVTYPQEWPGVQTQTVMRALIEHLNLLDQNDRTVQIYPLWQLGHDNFQMITLGEKRHVANLFTILIERTEYLNQILACTESRDAGEWLRLGRGALWHDRCGYTSQECVRMALWCYEARAWRRKQADINRKEPAHIDDARPRAWRHLRCSDVPFSPDDIESRPIGEDGHIIPDWS